MARSKQQVRKLTTEKQPTHNDPKTTVRLLQDSVAVLTKSLKEYQESEDSRLRFQRE